MRRRRSLLRSGRFVSIVVICLLLVGQVSHVVAQQDATPAPEPADAKPSARMMIGEMLNSGVIDYPTSLEYRAFAFFGDRRLPAELTGHPVSEDNSLFAESKRYWSDLPQSTRDILTPFLARPNDSRSVFFSISTEAGSTPPTPGAAPEFAQGDCGAGWAARDSDQFPFKVWTQCTGDYEGDLAEAIRIVNDFWEREVAFMGPPILDTGSEAQGGDERLDIYFAEDESDVTPRYGATINAEAAAYAASDDPFTGNTSSAFVVARRPDIGDPALTIVMAHEFFHVLQDAHNQPISFGFSSTHYNDDFDILNDAAEYWFTEATATWVMSYLYRDTLPTYVMQQTVHYRFIDYFQTADVPLYDSPRQWTGNFSRIYGAYVYFLFMEQELGPQAIADFYDRLRTYEADNLAATTALLDEILPMKEHFRDFAVRNLNLDLQPGDPISPSYTDIDPTFLEGIRPPMILGDAGDAKLHAQSSDEDPLSVGNLIQPLSAHYAYQTVDADVQQLTLDFTSMTPQDALDVDMIVKIRDGEWERRQLDVTQPTTFCFDDPANNVQAFYLVLSNHALTDADTIRGAFSISALDSPCA